jgi:hypothetical protein
VDFQLLEQHVASVRHRQAGVVMVMMGGWVVMAALMLVIRVVF